VAPMTTKKYTKEYLTKIVKECTCMWDVVEKVGISKNAGSHRYISSYIKEYKISTSHFTKTYKTKSSNSLEDYLVDNKFLTINGNNLKGKLFEAKLLENECCLCGQGEIWNGKKISLILDHIDGNRTNNKIENLRIVCPNCNATLDTHCGKNKNK
jgi:hypothetical protein